MTYMIDGSIFSTFANLLFYTYFADLFSLLLQITTANLLLIKSPYLFIYFCKCAHEKHCETSQATTVNTTQPSTL